MGSCNDQMNRHLECVPLAWHVTHRSYIVEARALSDGSKGGFPRLVSPCGALQMRTLKGGGFTSPRLHPPYPGDRWYDWPAVWLRLGGTLQEAPGLAQGGWAGSVITATGTLPEPIPLRAVSLTHRTSGLKGPLQSFSHMLGFSRRRLYFIGSCHQDYFLPSS